MADNPFRNLPSVNEILELPGVRALGPDYSHEAIVTAVRQELADLRNYVKQGADLDGLADPGAVAGRVAERLGAKSGRGCGRSSMPPASCCTPTWAGPPLPRKPPGRLTKRRAATSTWNSTSIPASAPRARLPSANGSAG